MTDTSNRLLLIVKSPAVLNPIRDGIKAVPEFSFDLETAASLDQGLDALRLHPFDAAVLDLDSPGCAGLSGLVRLCQAYPDLAVIALCTSDDPALLRGALQSGAEDFLVTGEAWWQAGIGQIIQKTALRRRARAAASPLPASSTPTLGLKLASKLEPGLLPQAAAQAQAGSISASKPMIFAAPFGVFVTDGRRRFLDANPFGLGLLGYTLPELCELGVEDTTALEDRPALENAHLALQRDGSVEIELRQRTKTGGIFWMNIIATVLAPDRVVVFGRDITDQRAAARGLAENERLLKQGTALAGLGIWELDPETGKMVWNDEVLRICGYEHKSYGGYVEDLFRLIHPDDAPQRQEQIKNLLRSAKLHKGSTGENQEFTSPPMQIRIVRPDGAVRRLRVETAAFWDERGQMRLRGVVLDITERILAEEQVQKEKAKYRDVVRTSADGFWVVDSTGRILEVNEAYIELSGYSRQELEGMHISQLEASQSPQEIEANIRRLQDKDRELFETRHRTKDGVIWPVEITTSFWPEDGGRFFVFLRDLRQRKFTETVLRARLRIAEIAETGTIEDMLQYTLDTAELLTGSTIGFFHFVEPDQETLRLQTWSTNTLTHMCTAEGKGSHYAVSRAGVWVDCMKTHAPVIHNDYASLTHRKGMPVGHAPVARELVVPVLYGDAVVAILGVGNKMSDYVQTDIETVKTLAWYVLDLVERKRAESARQESERRYRLLGDNLVDVVWLLDVETMAFTYFSPSITRQLGYSIEEALQKKLEDLLPSTNRGTVTQEFPERLRAFAAGELWAATQTDEVPVLRKDQSYLWTELVTTLLRGDRGELVVLGVSRDISERKHSQEQLQQHIDRLKIAQQASQSGFWDWDMRMGELYWSDEFNKLFEMTFSTPVSFESWAALLYPEDAARARETLQQALDQHIPLYNEYRIQLPDGTLKDIQMVGRTTYDDDGQAVRMTGICIDVSERKQMERALKASEERYRAMVETAFDWVWEADASGRYIFASPRVVDILGYQPAEVIGRVPFDLMTEEDASQFVEIFYQTLAAKKPFSQLENIKRHKNGQMVVLETNGVPVLDAHGKLTGYRGMDRDITARKQFENQLRESEEKFRLAFDTNPDALSITNMKTGEYVLVNEGFLTHSGYTREEVLFHTALELNLVHDPDQRFRLIHGLQEEGQVRGHEFQFFRKNGDLRYGEAALKTFDLNGEPHLLTILRDITQRRQAEEGLRQRGEELAQLLEIGRLLASTLELKQIYASLFQSLRQSIACDSLMVASFEVWEQVIRCDYSCDTHGEIDVSAFPLLPLEEHSQGGLSQVIREGTSLLLSEYHPLTGPRPHARVAISDIRRAGDLSDETGDHPHSAILVPITRDGRVNGALQVFSKHMNAFTLDHLRFVETLSHMVSTAVTNAGLFQRVQTELTERNRIQSELRLQISRMGALAQTSQQLAAASSDFNAIVNTVVHRVADLFGDGCIFRIANDDGTEMETVGLFHPDSEVSASMYSLNIDKFLLRDQDILGNQADSAQPIIITDLNPDLVAASLRPQAQAWLKSYGTTHLAIVHIWMRGVLFGSLALVRIAPSKPFSGDEIAFLQDIADRAGLAVSNARLMSQIRRANAVLEQRVHERTAELSQTNAELARASRAKDEFLASMSHELRTPLSAVLTLSESIEEGTYGPVNDRIKKPLRTVIESGHHLLTLINDLLDLSKIGAGKLELNLQQVELEAACAASFRMVRQQAELKLLVVVTPDSLPVKTISADNRLLKQMLVNLLSNAVKFTPAGGEIGLNVRILQPGTISFTVWDTGIGIAPEHIERLFKPFVQIDAGLNRQYGGTGLGLSLVRQMAELHGGCVGVTSELGKGSRFTITLPQEQLDEKTGAANLVRAPAKVFKVWIIDATGASALKYEELFDGLGIKPVFLSVEQLSSVLPDLIIRDLAAPDSLFTAAFQHNPRLSAVPTILIGDENSDLFVDRQVVVDLMLKPVNRQRFSNAMKKAASIIEGNQKSIHTTAAVSPVKKPIILIGEDNLTNQTTYADFLEGLGYQVFLASNGLEVIEQARAKTPDLILLDIQMPEMDGLTALQIIRADSSLAHIPVVALTALAMSGDRERCLRAGANEYISKPASLRHLAEVVALLVHTHHG